jgi:hypothetical protein
MLCVVLGKRLLPWSLSSFDHVFTQMVDQTITKPIGLIRDLKMYVHGIPYISTFIVL